MKAKAVSALRSERGLRTVKRNAEPQVVGLAPQTTSNDRKANTMKTYILRDPKTVEPQKIQFAPAPAPSPAAPQAAHANGPILYIGLDVPNDSIAVALAPSDSPEVGRYGILGGQHDDVLRLIKKLAATHPGAGLSWATWNASPARRN